MTFFIVGLADDSPSSLVDLSLELVIDTPDINVPDRQNILPLSWQKRWTKLDLILTGPNYPVLDTMNIKFIEHQSSPATKGSANLDGTTSHIKPNMYTLERQSLTWLRGYFEVALPRLHSSMVKMQLEYCILRAKDPTL